MILLTPLRDRCHNKQYKLNYFVSTMEVALGGRWEPKDIGRGKVTLGGEIGIKTLNK